MQIAASILVIAAVALGEIDWTKITIEPPMALTPTAAGVNLSSIVLDDPGSISATVGILMNERWRLLVSILFVSSSLRTEDSSVLRSLPKNRRLIAFVRLARAGQ